MTAEKVNPLERTQEKEPSYTKKITAYPWETTLDQIDALARQRRREQPSDLQRLVMYIGTLFISIHGERGPDGKYGLWPVEFIQEQIRSWVAIGDDWLNEQGHPLHAREADGSVPNLTALVELLMRSGVGGPSFGGATSSGEHMGMNSALMNLSPALPSKDGQEAIDPLAGVQDFVLDATIGADLNLDENEIV